jgi:hypothetical protein
MNFYDNNHYVKVVGTGSSIGVPCILILKGKDLSNELKPENVSSV